MPIKLDIEGETKNINEKLDKLAAQLLDINDNYKQVNQSGKQVFEAANKGASETVKTTNDVIKAIQNEGKAYTELQGKAKSANEEASKGFDKNKVEAYAKAIEQVKRVFEKSNFSITLDAAKQKALENMLANAKDDFEVLKIAINAAKDALDTLPQGSAEFTQLTEQIQVAEVFMEELAGTTEETEVKTKSLKGQLRAMKEELARMEDAGLDGTEAFRDMQVEAGKLEDQIGDTAQQVKILASDTKNLDAGIQAVQGLVGAYTAFQGISALVGTENEEFQKTLLKLNAAMATLQGIQQVANVLNKDSIVNVVLSNALRKKSIADILTESALRKVVNAQLILETAMQSKNIVVKGAATIAQKALNAAMAANPILIVVLALTTLIGALALFTDSAETAEEANDRLNKSLEISDKVYSESAERIAQTSEKKIATLKKNGAKESAVIQEQINRDKKIYQTYNDEIALLKEDRDREKNPEARVTLTKAIEAKVFEQKKRFSKLEIDLINQEGQLNKEKEDDRKKAAEDADKATQARLQRAKEINDQLIKFSRQLKDAQLEAITNTYEQERQLANENTARKIQDLEAEKSLTKQATEVRNQLILQLRENLKNELVKIDAQEQAERARVAIQTQVDIIALQQDTAEKEIELIKLNAAQQLSEYEKTYKDNADALAKIRINLEQQTQRKIEEVKLQNSQKDLQLEEEREVLRIELLSEFAGKGEEVENAKQQEILRTKIEYAKKSLDLLVKSGKAENDLAVLQAKKTIQDLEKELDAAKAQKGEKTIFDLLGIKVENEKEVLDSIKTTLGTFTNYLQQQADKQLAISEQIVQKRTSEVESLRKKVEDEKALAEQGLANNLERTQKELEIARNAQQQAIADRRKAAQQQFLLDSVIQASNLTVAATEIYRRTAKDPFTTALATITVGAMIAAFVLERKKAYESTKLEKGGHGIVKGKRHSRGGENFDDHIEVEDGEGWSVYNRKATAKHGGFLSELTDMVNSNPNNFYSQLYDLLESNNIASSMVRETDSADLQLKTVSASVNVSANSQSMDKAAQKLQKAAEQLMQGEKIEYYDWGYVVKKGNNVQTVRYKK